MWMRVDDGLHAHRKTRAVTKGQAVGKARDAAPMGLWVLAGSWSGRNNQDGWVPCDELDRFDDEWEPLAKRLVASGFWWPEQRNGEDGYGFNDWGEWNNPTGPSASGTFGNHVRWHVNKGVAKTDCEHCPQEPDAADLEPEYRPDSHPTRGDHRPEVAPISPPISDLHRPESLTRPDPTRPEPLPVPTTSSDKSDQTGPPNRFEDWWDTYGKKDGRKKCEVAYRVALKKPGVTDDLLIAAAASYITWQMAEGKHPQFTKNPLTWLHGEHWTDERPARPAPQSNMQAHLALVQQLADEETAGHYPQIGGAS